MIRLIARILSRSCVGNAYLKDWSVVFAFVFGQDLLLHNLIGSFVCTRRNSADSAGLFCRLCCEMLVIRGTFRTLQVFGALDTVIAWFMSVCAHWTDFVRCRTFGEIVFNYI